MNDYVSETDLASEAAILDVIRRQYPEHTVIAEESGTRGGSDFTWIVDPLDGTTNFVHGYPAFSVSVALCEGASALVGVIVDPLREECFWAELDGGAFLNDTPIRVRATSSLAEAFLATGFPFRAHADLEAYLRVFRRLFSASLGTRRAGSAALDLGYVACGRFDAFWEFYLKPWDTAAGGLLVSEAGGRVTDLFGEPSYREAGHVLASNGIIHDALLANIATALRGQPLCCAPPGHRTRTHERAARLP